VAGAQRQYTVRYANFYSVSEIMIAHARKDVNGATARKGRRGKTSTMRRSDSHVSSFAKGLEVIKAFGPAMRRMTLTDVAARTGLTRAAARRILLTLCGLGYMKQDGRLFFLTPRILDLGYSYLSSMPLADLAQPVMIELAGKLNHSCSVAALDGTDAVYILRVPKRSLLASPSVSLVGMRLPAYVSSMGRVLLAGLPPGERKAVLDATDLRPYTSRTVFRRRALDEEIRRCAKQGYAVVVDELEEGLSAVAVPIVDGSGRAIAAMNIACNSAAVKRQELVKHVLPELQRAVSRINAILAVGHA
jgi:IclR family transcriptional regulator, pca regulon regulatory protein